MDPQIGLLELYAAPRQGSRGLDFQSLPLAGPWELTGSSGLILFHRVIFGSPQLAHRAIFITQLTGMGVPRAESHARLLK